MSKINIFVNGKAEEVDNGVTILDLLAKYKLNPETVVVEVNAEIKLRSEWQAVLVSGDVLELVRFVGGG